MFPAKEAGDIAAAGQLYQIVDIHCQSLPIHCTVFCLGRDLSVGDEGSDCQHNRQKNQKNVDKGDDIYADPLLPPIRHC